MQDASILYWLPEVQSSGQVVVVVAVLVGLKQTGGVIFALRLVLGMVAVDKVAQFALFARLAYLFAARSRYGGVIVVDYI